MPHQIHREHRGWRTMAENPPPSVVDGLIQCLYRSFGATTFHTSLAPWAINPNSSSGARSLPSSMSGGDVNRLVAYIRQVPEHNLGRKLLQAVESNLGNSSINRSNDILPELAIWTANNIFDIVTVLLQIESIRFDVIEACLLWIIRGHVVGRAVSYCINLLSNHILMMPTTPQAEIDVGRSFRLLRNCVDVIFGAASDSDAASSASCSRDNASDNPPACVFDLIAPCASASQALSRRHRGFLPDSIDGAYAVSTLLQQSWTRRFSLYCHLLCDLSPYLSKSNVMQFQRKIVESLGTLPCDDVASILGACIRLFEVSLDSCWMNIVRIIYSNISPPSLQNVEVLLESSLSVAHQRNDTLLLSCVTCLEDAVCSWMRSFILETYSEKNVYETHSDLDGILFVTLADVSLLLLIARVVLDLRGSFNSTEVPDSDNSMSHGDVSADQLTRTIMMTLLSYCFLQARANGSLDVTSCESIVSSLHLEDATSQCILGYRLVSADGRNAPVSAMPIPLISSSHPASNSSSSSDNPRNRQSWLACSRASALLRLCDQAARRPTLLGSCLNYLLDCLQELHFKAPQENEDSLGAKERVDVFIPQSVGVAVISALIVSVFRIVEPSRLTILQSAMRSLIDSSTSTWNNKSDANRQEIMLRVMTVLCRNHALMLRPLQSHLQTIVPMLFLLPQRELEIAIEPMLLAVSSESTTQGNADLHNAILMVCKKAAGQRDPERCIFGIQSLIRLFPSMSSEAQMSILRGLLVPMITRENLQEFRAAIQCTICTGVSQLVSKCQQRILSHEILLAYRGLLLPIFLETCVLVDIDGSVSPLPDYTAEMLETDSPEKWMDACKANGKPYFCTSKCYNRIIKSRAKEDSLTSLTVDMNSLIVALIAVEKSLNSSSASEAIERLCQSILHSSEANTDRYSGSWLAFVLCSCINWLREGFCVTATNDVLRTDLSTDAAVAAAFGLLRGLQQILLASCFHSASSNLQERDGFEALSVLLGMQGLLLEASSSSGQALQEAWRGAVFTRKLKASGSHLKSVVETYPIGVEASSSLLAYQVSRATELVDAVSRGVYQGVLDPFLDLMSIVDALRESTKIFESVASICCQNDAFTLLNKIFSIFQSLGCAQVEDSLLSAASCHLFCESRSLEPPLRNIPHLKWNRGDLSVSSGGRSKRGKGRRSIFSDFSDDSSDDEAQILDTDAPGENFSTGRSDFDARSEGWSVYATSCYSLCGVESLSLHTSDPEPRWMSSAWVLQWSSAKQFVPILGIYRSPTSSKNSKMDKIRWKAMRTSLFTLRLSLLNAMISLAKISYDFHNEAVLFQVLSNSCRKLDVEAHRKLCDICNFIADDFLRSSMEGLTQALLESYLDALSTLLKVITQSRAGGIQSESESDVEHLIGLELSDKILRILCYFDHLTVKAAVKIFSLSIMAAGSSISCRCTQVCKMLWLSAGFSLRSRTVRANRGMDVLACLPSATSSRSKNEPDFPPLALKLKDRPSLDALQIGSLRCIDTIIRSRKQTAAGGTSRAFFSEKEASLLLFFNTHVFITSPEEAVNNWIFKTLPQCFELFDSKAEKSEASVFGRLSHRSRACFIDALTAFLSSIANEMWTLRRYISHAPSQDQDRNEGSIQGKRPRKSVRKLNGSLQISGDNVPDGIPFLVALLQNSSFFVHQILPRLNEIDDPRIQRHIIELEVNLSVLMNSVSSLQRRQNKLSKYDGHFASVVALLQLHGASLLSALHTALGTFHPAHSSSMQNEVDTDKMQDEDDISSTDFRAKKPKRRRRQRRLHSRNAVVNAWLAEEDGAEDDMYADLEDFLVA